MNKNTFVRSIFSLFVLHYSYVYSFGDDHVRARRQSDSSCVTPRDEKGVCIKIRKCPTLYTLRSFDSENIRYIQKSLCGIETGVSKVCCPNSTLSAVAPGPTTSRISTSDVEPGNPDICGKPSTTDAVLFGDKNAGPSSQTLSALGNWPWMVSIRYEYPSLNSASPYSVSHKCAGVLISKQYVLTVASCLSKRIPIHSIRLGDLDLGSKGDGVSPIDLQTERVIIHPQYALTPRLINNIALIRLNRSVEYTPTIRPVCLLNGRGYLTDDYYYKRIPFLVGWEYDAKQYHLNAEMVNISKCQRDHENLPSTIDQRVLCASVNASDCQEDHLAPLFFVELNDKAEVIYYLGGVGIMMFGLQCKQPGFPGVYSRVAAYIDWISQTTGLKF